MGAKMPLVAVAAVTAGASIYSANKQASAAKKAAAASQAATDQATALQQQQYDQTRADNEPWRQAGVSALGRLQDPAAFQASPDYQFRLGRGLEAVSQSRILGGIGQSGGSAKALNDYGQGMAASEYGNWFNRQSSLAGLGQSANAANQNAGAAYAGNTGNLLIGNADRLSSSYQQRADAASGLAGILSGQVNAAINNYPWGANKNPGSKTNQKSVWGY